jgi:hypothetical protein
VPANWKLAHENYLDVLHKFKIHPELEKAAPLQTNSAFEWHGDIAVVDHALENPTEGRGSELPTLPGLSDRVRNLGVAAHLFPNTNFMYWRDQLVLFVCEFLEPNVLLDELVRADDDVNRTGGQSVYGGVRLFFGSEPREQFHRDRELGHALAEGVVVLLRQNGGLHEHGHLPPTHHRLERRPDGHLGFAKAHITTNQPVHWDIL